MKTGEALLVLGAVIALVAGAVALSARLDQGEQQDRNTGAVAAAINAHYREIFAYPVDPPPASARPIDSVTLCVASNVPLNFALLARHVSASPLRPVPVADCTSKTVEGDFGMFTAMTTWFDKRGNEAAHLDIKAVRCPTQRRCIVEIDDVGAGMSYEVRRSDRGWTVVGSKMRWIV